MDAAPFTIPRRTPMTDMEAKAREWAKETVGEATVRFGLKCYYAGMDEAAKVSDAKGCEHYCGEAIREKIKESDV
jgi:hypothetical protein